MGESCVNTSAASSFFDAQSPHKEAVAVWRGRSVASHDGSGPPPTPASNCQHRFTEEQSQGTSREPANVTADGLAETNVRKGKLCIFVD